ncbi:TetR/AcrR family transcriptional regulator [Actinomadura kijaniata]|uniref:TetR/AcrR family transcriptional regulator n=1 Tax=Actinomadura kijaniata TaxID=46161 RepID=UPI000834A0E4|nr:TetR/AcrR family transcriptional regulator [Actinomadura kijaniata]
MGQKGEQTRARLLDAARDLIESGGYFNAGLNQVIAASGAPKGSLYFHFPGGKDQLVEESVRRGGREITRLMADLPGDGTAERLTALLGILGDRLEASGWRKGCPVATVALEMAAISPELRAACSEVYSGWEDALAGGLAADGHPAPAETATAILALVEGALVLARAHQSRTPLDRAAKAVSALL